MAVDSENSFDGPSTSMAQKAHSSGSDDDGSGGSDGGGPNSTMIQSYKERIRARRSRVRSRKVDRNSASMPASARRTTKSNGRVRGRPPFQASKTDRLWNMLKRNGLNPGTIIHSPDLRLLSYDHLNKINKTLRRELKNYDEPEPDLVLCDEEIAFQAFEDEENFTIYSKFKVLDITDCLIMEKSNNDNSGYNPNGYRTVVEESVVQEVGDEEEDEEQTYFSDESSHSNFVDPGEVNDHDFDISNERIRNSNRRPKRNCKSIPYHLQDIEFNDEDNEQEFCQPDQPSKAKRQRTSSSQQQQQLDYSSSNDSFRNNTNKTPSPSKVSVPNGCSVLSPKKSNINASPARHSLASMSPIKSPISYKSPSNNLINSSRYVDYRRDSKRSRSYDEEFNNSKRQGSVVNQNSPLRVPNLVRARLLKLPASKSDSTPKSYLKIDGRLFEVNYQFNGQTMDVMIDAKVVEQLRQIPQNTIESFQKKNIRKNPLPPPSQQLPPPQSAARSALSYSTLELNPDEQANDPNSKHGFRVFESDIPEMLSDADPSEKSALVERFFKMLTKRYNKCFEEHSTLHKSSQTKRVLGGNPMDPTKISEMMDRISRCNRLYTQVPKAVVVPSTVIHHHIQPQQQPSTPGGDRPQFLRFISSKPVGGLSSTSIMKTTTIPVSNNTTGSNMIRVNTTGNSAVRSYSKSSIILNPYTRVGTGTTTATTPTIISTRKVLSAATPSAHISGGKVYTINSGNNKLSFILPKQNSICTSSVPLSTLGTSVSNKFTIASTTTNTANSPTISTVPSTVRLLIRKNIDSNGQISNIHSIPLSTNASPSSISSISSSSSPSNIRSLNVVLNPSSLSASSSQTTLPGKSFNVVNVNSPKVSVGNGNNNKFHPLHQTGRNSFRIVQSINGNKVVVCDKPIIATTGNSSSNSLLPIKISSNSLLSSNVSSAAANSSSPKVILTTSKVGSIVVASPLSTSVSSGANVSVVNAIKPITSSSTTTTTIAQPIVKTNVVCSSASSSSASSLLSPRHPKVLNDGMTMLINNTKTDANDNVVVVDNDNAKSFLKSISDSNCEQRNSENNQSQSVLDDSNNLININETAVDGEECLLEQRLVIDENPVDNDELVPDISDTDEAVVTQNTSTVDEVTKSNLNNESRIELQPNCDETFNNKNNNSEIELIEIDDDDDDVMIIEPTTPTLTPVDIKKQNPKTTSSTSSSDSSISPFSIPVQPLQELMTTLLLLIRSLYFSNQTKFSYNDERKKLIRSFVNKPYKQVVRDCLNTLEELGAKQKSLLDIRDVQQKKNRQLVELLKGLNSSKQNEEEEEKSESGQLDDVIEELYTELEQPKFTTLVDNNEMKNLKLIGERLREVLIRDIDFNGMKVTLGHVLRLEHHVGIGRKSLSPSTSSSVTSESGSQI